MPKPKPLTRVKLLDHLRVASKRLHNKMQCLIENDPRWHSGGRFHAIRELADLLFKVQCLAMGHVDAWHEYLETLWDNINA
jgi:hypothetical protein